MSSTMAATRSPFDSNAASDRAQCSAHRRTRSAETQSASDLEPGPGDTNESPARDEAWSSACASAGCSCVLWRAPRSSSKRSRASRCTSPWRAARAARPSCAAARASPWSRRLDSAARTATERTAWRAATASHARDRSVAHRTYARPCASRSRNCVVNSPRARCSGPPPVSIAPSSRRPRRIASSSVSGGAQGWQASWRRLSGGWARGASSALGAAIKPRS
mmetsp:Transcript_25454/g.87337  ORF Transcript_25454/g.87337 Transcript_25454/m.87337 type:complete len:221 (-) Transcript_25454:435-1097(-)